MNYFALLCVLLISSVSVFASTTDADLLATAKAVKAIYDKGEVLPQITAIDFAELPTAPPKKCVMIIYERRPNTVCPDSLIGPYFDKGFAACLNSSTQEVDSITPVQSQESDCLKSLLRPKR